MRVIVVGAGFAGLAAADELQRQGVEVIVLEARSRVGGRVYSQAFAGAVVERGAEFIMAEHQVLIGLCQRFGLQLADKGVAFGNREPRGGIGVNTADYQTAIATLDFALQNNGPSNGQSVQDYLGQLPMHAGAREAIIARIEITNGVSAERLDATTLGQDASDFGNYPTFTLVEGNDSLAKAMAATIKHLQVDSPVWRIQQRGERYYVSTDENNWHADAVVVSVPASVVHKITFMPPLPSAHQELISRIQYGHAAKLFVALEQPAPASAVVSVAERFWTSTGAGPEAKPLPYCVSFAGSTTALQQLDIANGSSHWVEQVKNLRPDLALNTSNTLLSTWHDEPWTDGVYSYESLGLDKHAMQALANPIGKLIFCGEHTAGEYFGYMEGALRSGYAAATALLKARNEPARSDHFETVGYL
jgi:monoamine oxidase